MMSFRSWLWLGLLTNVFVSEFAVGLIVNSRQTHHLCNSRSSTKCSSSRNNVMVRQRRLNSVRSPSSLYAYNFGPASSLDTLLYTAARPGNPEKKNDKVEAAQIYEWIDFMKEIGVRNVVSLLDDNEYDNYPEPGLLKIYEQRGINCLPQPMREPGAADKIYRFIRRVKARDEKVVTHCTGGIGRCGRVAAGWLVVEYGLSPKEATEEVLKQASKSGVIRKGDEEMLEEWLFMKP